MAAPYSPAELQRLRAEFATAESIEALAASIGRSAHGLKAKAYEIGLTRPRPEPAAWRTAIIQARYPSAPDLHALAAELGLTYSALKAHASRFGVGRTEDRNTEARKRGGQRSAEVRRAKARAKALPRAVRATPLDAAWRGLLLGV